MLAIDRVAGCGDGGMIPMTIGGAELLPLAVLVLLSDVVARSRCAATFDGPKCVGELGCELAKTELRPSAVWL